MEHSDFTAVDAENVLNNIGLFESVNREDDIVIAVMAANIARIRFRLISGLPVIDAEASTEIGWTDFTSPITCLDTDFAVITEWITAEVRRIVANARQRANKSIIDWTLNETAWDTKTELTAGSDGINRIECGSNTAISVLPASDGSTVILVNGRFKENIDGSEGMVDSERLQAALKTVLASYGEKASKS